MSSLCPGRVSLGLCTLHGILSLVECTAEYLPCIGIPSQDTFAKCRKCITARLVRVCLPYTRQLLDGLRPL